MSIPVLIPAYNPDDTLLSLAEDLVKHGFNKIIIVNDGSDNRCNHIFDKLKEIEYCHVLHHAVNLGKGRAIKTGLNHICLRFGDEKGVVTMDADGQHLPRDVARVAETFQKNSGKLVMGVRKFDQGTPLRSLLGNTITRHVFRFLVGKKLSDTQSGLRCIPMNMVPDLIRLEGERYEYEMNMLISTKTTQTDIIEEEITTVYLDNNRSSHFNPLIDSMKIYFLLLRFSFSSLATSAIDFVVFIVFFHFNPNVSFSIAAARAVAGTFNFTINKTFVFHNKHKILPVVAKYCMSLIFMGLLSTLIITTMSALFHMNVIVTKLLTEMFLFTISFAIQRDYIFAEGKHNA